MVSALRGGYRSVFFSFDYDDVFRVNQVRNSGRFAGVKKSGFKDKAEYEKVKLGGKRAIENWIRRQMNGCSVTVVLIGRDTYKSDWVHFEIEESLKHKMGLVGVYIHQLGGGLMDTRAQVLYPPPNPLESHEVPATLGSIAMRLYPEKASQRYRTYTWQPKAQGALMGLTQNNLGDWVEQAYQISQRP